MICVAAMPRSGTSLVTQLLHRVGFDVGPADQLMPAAADNSDGFWENLRFVRLNERLLAESGGTWFAPPHSIRASPESVAEARAIVAQFDGREPWLWKDPRNALTLPFWRALLPAAKVLVCVRHPEETASSLVASNFIPWPWQFYWSVTRPSSTIRLDDGATSLAQRLAGAARATLSPRSRRALIHEVALEMWRVYNERILDETSAADRIVTRYETLLTDPRAELQRILAHAGVQVAAGTIEDAVGIVRPRMRHQRAGSAPLEPRLAGLYERLAREAGC